MSKSVMLKNSTHIINRHIVIPNFILDNKKFDVDMLRLCWTLVAIAVEVYSSYCHSVAIMTSRLSPSYPCNQENISWSGLLIVDTSNIIWICVSDQLQLIRFHVVFYRYRITFLAVFQWSIPELIKYLLSFSTVYAISDGYKLEYTSDFQPPMHMECLLFALSVGYSWNIGVDSTYLR